MPHSSTEPSPAHLAAENRRLSDLCRAAGIDPGSGPAAAVDAGASDHATTARRLRDEQDFARLLLNSMSEGFYVVDAAGRVTVCNTAMLRLLGFDNADEVIGTAIHGIIHHSHPDGSHYPAETCPIYRAARDGIAMVVDDELFFRRDGTSFPVEYRTEPLIRDGRLDGAICTFVDIGARVEGERRLKESEERLALAVQAGGIGIWDYAPLSGVLEWDDRVRALFGAAAGRPVSVEENFAAVHPADRPRVETALAAALDPSGSGTYEVQFRTFGIEDGKERWVEAQGQAAFRHGQAVRLLGVLRDISAQKEAERHLRLMVNELNHRVKNSLAMVQGVAAQTFRHSPDMQTAREAFTERLVALARAHDVLTATNWEGADLRHVVDQIERSHAGDDPGRFAIEGPSLPLSPKATLAFSLALHELATNAVKYGALSRAGGRVEVRWSVAASEERRRLTFAWTEIGGPVVAAPARRGFGTKLIERGLASELQGTVRIEFSRGGVICTIIAPLPPGGAG